MTNTVPAPTPARVRIALAPDRQRLMLVLRLASPAQTPPRQTLSCHACHASERAISNSGRVRPLNERNGYGQERRKAGRRRHQRQRRDKPTLNVLAQYVKDLSFESPGAPNSLRGRDKAPGININVNVNANPLSDKEFDVNLTLNAKATFDKDVLFNVELIYGGVFRIEGFPQEHMLPLLFIECPRLLFPFARQIIAEATRNGGFPPLMLDPIDFAQMFQQKLAEDQAKAKVQVS